MNNVRSAVEWFCNSNENGDIQPPKWTLFWTDVGNLPLIYSLIFSQVGRSTHSDNYKGLCSIEPLWDLGNLFQLTDCFNETMLHRKIHVQGKFINYRKTSLHS